MTLATGCECSGVLWNIWIVLIVIAFLLACGLFSIDDAIRKGRKP